LNIVYRDLKPENVLFGKDGHVRIADLGFAKKITEKTRTFCGTPSYLAPEVLNRQPYGMEVDWWTFGVLVFQLCSGCAPFQESHPTKTFARILNCAIRWPPKPQSYFTNEAFDLIMRLFELNPNERLKERDILAHEWFASVDFAMMKKRAIPAPVEVLAKIQMLSGEEYFPSENREQRVIVELSTGEYVESSERLFQGF
jgi:serine/threonine protein kinase